jgi:hypothetical protein
MTIQRVDTSIPRQQSADTLPVKNLALVGNFALVGNLAPVKNLASCRKFWPCREFCAFGSGQATASLSETRKAQPLGLTEWVPY